MKTYLFKWLSILLASQAIVAAQERQLRVYSSDIADGLAAKIKISSTTDVNQIHDDLFFGFRASESNEAYVYILKDQYFCRVELIDKEGNQVRPTRLGSQLGRDFDRVPTEFSQAFKRRRNGTAVRLMASADGSISKFYKCGDLFRIERNGIYTLKVKFQTVKQSIERGERKEDLVIFPVIEVPFVVTHFKSD